MEEKVSPYGCALDCGGKCLLYAHLVDGKVVKVEGPSMYRQEGRTVVQRVCQRGLQYPRRLYDEHRLRQPLIRVGKKGGTDFRKASWEEALDLVVKSLEKAKAEYGNESIMNISRGGAYTSALHNPGPWCKRLLNSIGGRVELVGFYSNDATVPMSTLTYGTDKTDHSRDDLPNAKLIILWGWNPLDNVFGSDTTYWLAEARKRGTRLVCVDPRQTATAKFCHEFIPIRPGTDAAMLIAMAHVIISEKLDDRAFIDRFTTGFEEFSSYVMGKEDGIPKTPQWAEMITGVPGQITASLARAYATGPSALIPGLGPQRTYMGEQFARAAAVLAAITGNIGVNGGNPAGAGHGPGPTGTIPPLLDNKVKISIPIFLWADLLLKGKRGGYPTDIEFVYLTAGNILNQHGYVARGCQALKQLHHLVAQDHFLTPSARYADVILPACTFMERNDIVFPWEGHGNFLLYQTKLVEPMYESRPDMQIFTDLADRFGVSGFNPKSEEEWLREYAAKWGIPDFEEFKRRGFYIFERTEPYVAFWEQIHEGKPFATPSGKIEIFSSVLAKQDDPSIPPVPKWLDDSRFEGPSHPLAARYPLQLLTPKARDRVNSTLYNTPIGRSGTQLLWINTADAAQRGVRDGDEVEVFNERGRCAVRAYVTSEIRKGVVSLDQGAWYSPNDAGVDEGANPNSLTSDIPTPYARATTQHTSLVDLVPRRS